jgi:hypothetical protein
VVASSAAAAIAFASAIDFIVASAAVLLLWRFFGCICFVVASAAAMALASAASAFVVASFAAFVRLHRLLVASICCAFIISIPFGTGCCVSLNA